MPHDDTHRAGPLGRKLQPARGDHGKPNKLSDHRAKERGRRTVDCARSTAWRETPDVGEAFTMLTMERGPDIAPYHDRQIVILERDNWADWLDPSVSAKSLIRPLPAGTLNIEQVG